MKILIAGATGAVGVPLTRLLCAAGHEVTGITRAGAGVDILRGIGAKPVVADVFNTESVRDAIRDAKPDVVIDQLTLLPADPAELIKYMPNDTRLHQIGGKNLLSAAEEFGVKRYIMQSRGFYLQAAEGELAAEDAKLCIDAPGVVGESARTFQAYEDEILASQALTGVVLRYGFFYGPGTWYHPTGAIAEQARKGESVIIGRGNGVWSFVHLDDAIEATVAALHSECGVYNIVDDNPLPVSEWLPAFSKWVGAPLPGSITAEQALRTVGSEALFYNEAIRGASNLRAKELLDFKPRRLLWLQ
ncbi:NAD-dependent epimerase/dehydratase family protein [Pseudomonas reactans]|jgi:nucleoside-diphosphate-sugar epimerase|uniref:NAD(P)-dependent oxidoreductase n=3 Tax=Pseudomonas TaxID=286 RepID=A0A7Y8G214_9PSED|nr:MULTISPECIES: NAD(P)-dependent oxidoreductase [Pseudomonas]KGE66862.1 dTDP-4-dehydrorhamnose reductase [Pseudomonas fluorescens LMG 5329]NWA38766.1 NAD(P)-dependent oxidoreductase [Pseudomonas reactans]NWB30221.1 NAD(P)-dependent oxidoreductase [Pseudomonas gingeri]NWC36695.1 NAD(P)-dependent oxidoreductase [Pseudomonas gingeri]NWC75618.1 NAD(P)-dependent oxidoreductase [Pseudomonas sp. P7759]